MRFLLTVAFCVFPLTIFAQDEVVEIVSDETPKQEVVEEVLDEKPIIEILEPVDVIPPKCETNFATLRRATCTSVNFVGKVACTPFKVVSKVFCHARTRSFSFFRRRCCR